jgi:thioredoxin-related protein
MKIKALLLFTALLFIESFQLIAQESTDKLLEKAQLKATKEGKAIFIKFEASWCGWCHRMTRNMNAPTTKKIFEDNYVVVPVVVNESKGKKDLENPGSTALLKKFKGEKAGLPFWVVLDKKLNVLTDSFDVYGLNLGGVATSKEVRVFIRKLKRTAANFSKKDATSIKKQFILKK